MSAGQLEDVVTGNKYSTPKWMAIAAGELGQKETDPYSRVAQYFESDGVVPDPRGTPWCRYFLNWCLRQAGWTVPKGGMARGLKDWGSKVELEDAQLGDIIILWRGTHDDGVSGHIGFFIKQDGQYIWLLGGNQGDAVTEAKFLKSKFLHCRRPKGLLKSKTSWTAVTTTASGAGLAAKEVLDAVPVTQVVEAKSVFEQALQYFPDFKLMLGVLIVAAGLYALYLRKTDETK